MSETVKAKKTFRMPHLLYLMLGMILFMSVMTYVIPAGAFATDLETGALIGAQFELLGRQTPVNPYEALLMLLPGLQASSYVLAMLLSSGGAIYVILQTKALDNMIDYAIYKLQDKGINVLLPAAYVAFCFLGAFGGGDHVIALIPVGLMFAKKLRLDPIIAIALTLFTNLLGFSCSPTNVMIAQSMMGVPIYSGFGTRLAILCLMIAVSLTYIYRYARKVAKDPNNSVMGKSAWYDELDDASDVSFKEVKFNPRSAVITILFFSQYLVTVIGVSVFKQSTALIPAVQICNATLCGLIAGWKFEDIGNAFSKGAANIAFVCFVIGCAATISLVMSSGNILHTIVYYACVPLRKLGTGFASVGISGVISCVNLLIPSQSAKAAILIPIVKPMCEALNVSSQVGVLAFQFGDGFTNMISPVLGAVVGSLAIAKIEFGRYIKWVAPIVVVMTLLGWVILYLLGGIGWTGM